MTLEDQAWAAYSNDATWGRTEPYDSWADLPEYLQRKYLDMVRAMYAPAVGEVCAADSAPPMPAGWRCSACSGCDEDGAKTCWGPLWAVGAPSVFYALKKQERDTNTQINAAPQGPEVQARPVSDGANEAPAVAAPVREVLNRCMGWFNWWGGMLDSDRRENHDALYAQCVDLRVEIDKAIARSSTSNHAAPREGASSTAGPATNGEPAGAAPILTINTIERFSLVGVVVNRGENTRDLERDPDGEWVRFEDAAAISNRLASQTSGPRSASPKPMLPEGMDALCEWCEAPFTFASSRGLSVPEWKRFCSNLCTKHDKRFASDSRRSDG